MDDYKNKVFYNKGRLVGEREAVQVQPVSWAVVVQRAQAAQQRMVQRALAIQHSLSEEKEDSNDEVGIFTEV